jgi:hypothetical protein
MSVDVIAEKPAALKLFLIDRRCRPASVGLPTRSRRNPGLTRQQIAELIDVSSLWYALFRVRDMRAAVLLRFFGPLGRGTQAR